MSRPIATVRLTGRAPEQPVVDLLFASSGIERELVAAAEPIELIRGLCLPVARIEHLIALKVLSRDDINRPQDVADLRALLRASSHVHLVRARELLTLITSRGYHRGRDLIGSFEQLTALR